MKMFIYKFRSEWLKTRRSAASWLVIAGGIFIPLIFLIIQVFKPQNLSTLVLGDKYWDAILLQAWESTAALLLPFGVILVTTLIAQLEFKNNAWKQVCTTPQSMGSIFSFKLLVILVMLLQFFLIFNLGLWAEPYFAAWLNHDLPYPPATFPWMKYLKTSALFYISSLPVVAIQYWISLRFGNFLISIGTGLGMVFLSLFLFRWEFGYLIPYTHNFYQFFQLSGHTSLSKGINLTFLSMLFFSVITGFSLLSFTFRNQRG
jgi:hypothetical protein